jgi:hypothetical protein
MLSAKQQEADMKKLKHKHITGTKSLWARAPGGGLIRETLIVQTDLHLDPGHPQHHSKLVSNLEEVVVEYANSLNPFKSIIFEENEVAESAFTSTNF